MPRLRGRRGAIFAVAGLLSLPSGADEGMWTPAQFVGQKRQLHSRGLDVTASLEPRPGDIFPLGAIVHLNNCTGSFVSPDGLILTNDHCVLDGIQYNSTASRDISATGFVARERKDELPDAPGASAVIPLEAVNVTDRIVGEGAHARDMTEIIQRNKEKILSECERDPSVKCEIVEYFGGVQFWLQKELQIKDLRLVYVPPVGIGNFGGATDNWMWPRQSGDFAFVRAYVAKNGLGEPFSASNVPYKPVAHVKFSRRGVSEGDFVFAPGYPMRTSRYRLPADVSFVFTWYYPEEIAATGAQMDIIRRETEGRGQAKLAYAYLTANAENRNKKLQGMLDSYQESSLLEDRRRQAAELEAWIRADRQRYSSYGDVVPALDHLLTERQAAWRQAVLRGYATPRLMDMAYRLYKLANERAKGDDSQRAPGYQQRDWPGIREMLTTADRQYDDRVDQQLVLHFVEQCVRASAVDRDDGFLKALGMAAGESTQTVRDVLQGMYSKSQLRNQDVRLEWMDRNPEAFRRSEDPFIRAAVAAYQADSARDKEEQELDTKIESAYRKYMEALVAFRGTRHDAMYPDANATLRVSYGQVKGRSTGGSDGTAWKAFTSLQGVLAKNTGSGDFNAPPEEISAIRSRQFGKYYDPHVGSVPVDFLSDLDITGGNSGSPVVNGKGELVGLVFDGTLDSVISDWEFNAVANRTIAVDVRYILWTASVVSHADSVLQELGER